MKNSMDNYPETKVGDRIVKFSYWNSPPLFDGEVVAQTAHFAEVKIKTTFGFRKEWISKDNVEVVQPML